MKFIKTASNCVYKTADINSLKPGHSLKQRSPEYLNNLHNTGTYCIWLSFKWGNNNNKKISSLQNNLLMLALLAFEVTIYRHQLYYRLRNKLLPPAARIIFHDVTRQHLDIGIVSFIKYFINYFFYKFGLEVQTSKEKRSWKPPLQYIYIFFLCLYLLKSLIQYTLTCVHAKCATQ